MKKGQISGQILIYTLSLIIFAGIFIYGYKSIQGMISGNEEVLLIEFEEKFKATTKHLQLRVGDVVVFDHSNPLKVPEYFTRLCFIDLNSNAPASVNPHVLIHDSWQNNV
jgi:hypothetical protein